MKETKKLLLVIFAYFAICTVDTILIIHHMKNNHWVENTLIFHVRFWIYLVASIAAYVLFVLEKHKE